MMAMVLAPSVSTAALPITLPAALWFAPLSPAKVPNTSWGAFAYLGIIGSKTKRRQFERGFRDLGLDEALIARTTCPIGGNAPRDKRPEVIAAMVAAELCSTLFAVSEMTAG